MRTIRTTRGVNPRQNIVNRNNAITRIIQNPTSAPGSNKSNSGTPQFPGANSGLSIPQLQNFNQQQPRVTGVPFTVGAGTTKITGIALPGDCKLLLGIMFTNGLVTDSFNMAINNNLIADNGSVFLHSPDNSQCLNEPYFPYIQPLSGKDSFDVEITSLAGLTGILQFVYI